MNLVDPDFELIDPTPDIHALFLDYNRQFFEGRLVACELKWSPRMTSCAGICSYEGNGGMCSIRLSTPILKLRPRSDLVETLLHEMIHAYLFVTKKNQDHDGHGPEFLEFMHRINRVAGTKISVYHNFHDEVRVYKTHKWRCDGPCRERGPYRGWVTRAMNRPPGPYDKWFADHQRNCSGTFIKVAEPEGYKARKKPGEPKSKSHSPEKSKASGSQGTLDGWMAPPQRNSDPPAPGQKLGGGEGGAGKSRLLNELEKKTTESGGGVMLGGPATGRSRLLDEFEKQMAKKRPQFKETAAQVKQEHVFGHDLPPSPIKKESNTSMGIGTASNPIVVDDFYENDPHYQFQGGFNSNVPFPPLDEWQPMPEHWPAADKSLKNDGEWEKIPEELLNPAELKKEEWQSSTKLGKDDEGGWEKIPEELQEPIEVMKQIKVVAAVDEGGWEKIPEGLLNPENAQILSEEHVVQNHWEPRRKTPRHDESEYRDRRRYRRTCEDEDGPELDIINCPKCGTEEYRAWMPKHMLKCKKE